MHERYPGSVWHMGCSEAVKKLQKHASLGSLLMKDCPETHSRIYSYAYQRDFLRHRFVTNETKYSLALTVQISQAA